MVFELHSIDRENVNVVETCIKTACHEFFKEYYDSKIQKRREQIN